MGNANDNALITTLGKITCDSIAEERYRGEHPFVTKNKSQW